MSQIIILSNGKRVANFSSAHPFHFEDGSILEGVSPEKCRELELKCEEIEGEDGDIEIKFTMTDKVKEELYLWYERYTIGLVDVVFVPLPVLQALKEEKVRTFYKLRPFRCVRMVDRVKKLVSINKQCM